MGIARPEILQIIASVFEPERTGVQMTAAIMSKGSTDFVMPLVRLKPIRLARIVAPCAR